MMISIPQARFPNTTAAQLQARINAYAAAKAAHPLTVGQPAPTEDELVMHLADTGDAWELLPPDNDEEAPPPTFEQLVQQRLHEIDTEREQRGYAPIAYEGHLYDADERGIRNLQGWLLNLQAGATLPPGFTWRSHDNVDVPCDAAMIQGIWNAIVVRGTQLYVTCWGLKAQVTALQDGPGAADALAAIQWPEA